MSTDFRALCAELVMSWDVDGCDWKPRHQAAWNATVERARAALAEPDHIPDARKMVKPVPPAGVALPPLLVAALELQKQKGLSRLFIPDPVHSVVLAPQPVPEGPSDEELLRCANIGTPCHDTKAWDRELRMMRAAIAADRARWGRQ